MLNFIGIIKWLYLIFLYFQGALMGRVIEKAFIQLFTPFHTGVLFRGICPVISVQWAFFDICCFTVAEGSVALFQRVWFVAVVIV